MIIFDVGQDSVDQRIDKIALRACALMIPIGLSLLRASQALTIHT